MRRTKTMLMGELLDEFFSRPFIARKVAEGKIHDTWREVTGNTVASLTTSLELKGYVLNVRIQSSVIRNELLYQRASLCNLINEKSGVELVRTIIIK